MSRGPAGMLRGTGQWEEKGRGTKQDIWGTVSVGLAKKRGCILWGGGPQRASEKKSWNQWGRYLEASAMGLEEWNGQAG